MLPAGRRAQTEQSGERNEETQKSSSEARPNHTVRIKARREEPMAAAAALRLSEIDPAFIIEKCDSAAGLTFVTGQRC